MAEEQSSCPLRRLLQSESLAQLPRELHLSLTDTMVSSGALFRGVWTSCGEVSYNELGQGH